MSDENHHQLSAADEADLAALADGRLPADRRSTVEARLALDAELSEALDRQKSAVSVLAEAAGSVSAPARLRATVERMEAERAAPRRRFRVPRL